MSGQNLYVVAALILWALLVWPDAARAQRLFEAYRRRRDPLIVVSLVGTLVRGVGLTVLLIGALKALLSPSPTVPGPAMKLIAIGGALLIAGWLARVIAWVLWKRRINPQG